MKILGHRGCIIEKPPYQNSIKAFEFALKYGDGFETDACVSADGEIFFSHEALYASTEVEYVLDEHLDADSQKIVGDKMLEEMPSTTIQKLKLIDGQPIPSWGDTVTLFKNQPNKIFNIELKAENVVQPLIKKLKKSFLDKALLPEQVIVSSFNHPALLEIRQAIPHIKIGALFISQNQKRIPLFPWSENRRSCYFPLTEKNLQSKLLSEINPEFIVGPHMNLDDNTVRIIQQTNPQAKMIIWIYTERLHLHNIDMDSLIQKYAKNGILHTVIVDDVRSDYHQ